MVDEAKGKNTEKVELKNFLDQEKINLTDKKLDEKSKELIAQNYSVSDLIKFSREAGGDGRDTIRSNILSILEIKDKLNTESSQKIKEERDALSALDEQKKLDAAKKEQDIAALKKLLNYDDKDNSKENNNTMNNILEVIALNKQNDQTLKDIKDLQEKLKKATDDKKLEEIAQINEEIENKKLELKGLLGQKDNLYYQYFGEKYDDDNGKGIQEFKRRGKIFGKGTSETGQTVHGIMSPLRPKRIARMRLNRVIRKMNEIGNDSTAGMKMVMNRCHFNGVRPIRRGMKSIANTFRLKNPAEFSAKYDEQANEFIRDLTKKLETAGKLSDDDKKTIALIEKRLKWYKEDYKRQFLQM